VGATLPESAGIYRAIGVNALDLIAIPGSCLDTYEIAADPRGQARRLNALGIEFSNLITFFGTDFRDRALNSPDATIRANNRETFRKLLDFCTTAGFHSITVLPGVEYQSHSRQAALAWTATELNRMNELANDAGVLLVYEPHVESILESPRDVVAFAQTQCDVKLVIDYSHAVSLGYARSDLEPLVAHAGHVHLRQAAPDKIQARWEEGSIDFPALIGLLKQSGYQGYLTLEYEHDRFWQMDRCDVMVETIRMRDVALHSLSRE
jgi:sugar phosphate isomerase/epimerase